MFSLIITILAIALVAILAYVALYYGSSAATEASARARAVTIVNQGEQIVGATQIFYVENNRAPSTLQELVDLGYLSKLPVPSGTKLAASSFSIISNAIAAEPDRWTWDPATRTLALVKAIEPTSVCAQVNNVSFKVADVKNAVDPALRVQCYGATSSEGYTVIWNANVPTDTKLSSGQYAACEGTKAIGHVPAQCDRGVVAPASAQTSTSGTTTSGTSDPLADLLISFIGGSAIPSAEISWPYTYDLKPLLTVTGDSAYSASNVSWSLTSGALPAGLSLGSDGVISGTPTAIDRAGLSFQVKASYKGKDGQQSFTITVGGQTLHVTQIALGGNHTCAVTTAGGVKCWGRNDFGQLGNSSTTNSSVPVEVYGLASGVSSISAGSSHSCALTTGGGVKCWGFNGHGYLGDNGTTNSSVPVNVSGLQSGVVSLAGNAASQHTCVITSGGGAMCWGLNGYGQLGNNSTADGLAPVAVKGLSTGVVQLTTGMYHTCAITSGAIAKCWGFNGYGQLGNNSNTSSAIPADVTNLSAGVTHIAGGRIHTCAVLADGAAKCWGGNDYGQLGNNSTAASWAPLSVTGLTSGVARVSTGGDHTCALTMTGAAKCWGYNGAGILGNGNATDSWVPVDVSGLAAGVAVIATGYSHTCAVTNIGSTRCWGYNPYGQLGNGSTSSSAVPADVSP